MVIPIGLRRVRLGLAVLYFIACFGILFFYTSGSSFCSRPNGPSRAMATLRLAFACTAWDAFASVCGVLSAAAIKKSTGRSTISRLVSTLIAGLGFASIPFWIYQGYGTFLFEGTWADVSCFFTEGYGMMFPFLVAPILAAATLLREWFIAGIQRRESTA